MADLLQIIKNIVDMMGEFTTVVSVVCFLIGVVMLITALKLAQKRQEQGPGQGGWNTPIVTFIIAGLFFSMPTLVNVLNVSLFGVESQSASSIFTYAKTTVGAIKGAEGKEMIRGLVLIVQFFGLIGVGRGLYLLNQSAQGGQGPKTFGPGLTFVIAGIIATNYPLVAGIIQSLISVQP